MMIDGGLQVAWPILMTQPQLCFIHLSPTDSKLTYDSDKYLPGVLKCKPLSLNLDSTHILKHNELVYSKKRLKPALIITNNLTQTCMKYNHSMHTVKSKKSNLNLKIEVLDF